MMTSLWTTANTPSENERLVKVWLASLMGTVTPLSLVTREHSCVVTGYRVEMLHHVTALHIRINSWVVLHALVDMEMLNGVVEMEEGIQLLLCW
jgi:hypothetical protein